jgi:hypothetical protein
LQIVICERHDQQEARFKISLVAGQNEAALAKTLTLDCFSSKGNSRTRWWLDRLAAICVEPGCAPGHAPGLTTAQEVPWP